MDNTDFDQIEQALESGPARGFDALAVKLRDRKNYPLLYEARLMKKRLELGIPLVQTGPPEGLTDETRRAYDQAIMEAAREAGSLFLAEGNIPGAWPYFRAIGENGPVSAAIDATVPGEGIEPVIAIAYQEAVNPYKGFELILGQYGICRAITAYGQYPARTGRDDCARLLVRTLHRELVASLKRSIANAEGSAPETESVPELIEGRGWLFGEYDYYVDSSHLVSIVGMSIELDDPETLALALELTRYGERLSTMFQFKGEPPFENVYPDHAAYLRALLGIDVDSAIEHFRRKIEHAEEGDTRAAEVLVVLLARLDRYAEAIEISLDRLSDIPAGQLACPSVYQLCEMAGDYERLMKIARDRGDLLHFAAGASALRSTPQPV